MTYRIYLGAYGRDSIAGPVTVAGIVFTQPITSSAIDKAAHQPRYISNNLDKTGELLDELEEDKDFFLDCRRVPVSRIERVGYNYAVSEEGRRIVHRLAVRYGIDPKVVWVSPNTQAIGSLYNEIKVDRESVLENFYVDLLAKYYQNWWMVNYYHSFCPEYGWDSNFGYKTERHLNQILYQGPSFDYHRSVQLKTLAKHWYRLVVNNDLWALCQPWLYSPPLWWQRLYPKHHFCHWLSDKEMTVLYQSFQRFYPREMSQWVNEELKDLGFPDRVREQALSRRLDVKEMNNKVEGGARTLCLD